VTRYKKNIRCDNLLKRRYTEGTKESLRTVLKVHLRYEKNTFELTALHSYFHHRTYFVEFTTRMKKNTALLFLFAVLAFHFSSHCILLLFSFVACLSSLLLFVTVLVSFLSLCSLVFFIAVLS